ncbi:hypothetical protein KKF84_05820 [Myxococcota bacterium]|nr:hypothetical protein [Myxococcota bacterium]
MSIFDLPVLISSARVAGKGFSVADRDQLEKWVEQKTDSYIGKGHLIKAYEIWASYTQALEPGMQGKRIIPLTRKLQRYFLKQGGITESLHTALFLEDFGVNVSTTEKRLIDWISEMDRLEYADCFAPVKSEKEDRPGRCHKQRKGDSMFQKIMLRYGHRRIRTDYWNYLASIYGFKAHSPGEFSLEQLAHLPLYAQKQAVVRVAGLLLFENKPLVAITRLVKQKQLASLAPWVKTTLERIIDPSSTAGSLDVVKTFFSVRMGDAFSRQICNVAEKRFGASPWVKMCMGQHALSLADSVSGRRYMVEALRGNVMLKLAWDGLFTISLKRFYHFIEREHLDLARDEARYLAAIHTESKKIWSAGDFRFSLATISLALADLYLIRGRVKDARAELQRTLAASPSAGILNSLIRIAYWSGDYPRVLALLEKYKELPEDKGYSLYLFMRMARYHAFTREKLGSARHARIIRYKTIEYYLRIFKNLADRDLQAELLVEAARIYLDDKRVDLAVQLFQFAMDRTESCGIYRTILQQYVMYGMIDEATNVYNSLMGLTSCAENRQAYGSVWLLLLAKRKKVNMETVQTAIDFLKGFSGDPWLKLLSRFVLEEIPLDKLMEGAQHLGQKAEGWFYGGYLNWTKGKISDAKKLFQKVLNTKIFIYSEFEMAHHILQNFQKNEEKKDSHKKSY